MPVITLPTGKLAFPHLPHVALPSAKDVARLWDLTQEQKAALAAAGQRGSVLAIAGWQHGGAFAARVAKQGATLAAAAAKAITRTGEASQRFARSLETEIARANTSAHDVVISTVARSPSSSTITVRLTNTLHLWYDVALNGPVSRATSDSTVFDLIAAIPPRQSIVLHLSEPPGTSSLVLWLNPATPKALALDVATLIFDVQRGITSIDVTPQQMAWALDRLSQYMSGNQHLQSLRMLLRDMVAVIEANPLDTAYVTAVVNDVGTALKDTRVQDASLTVLRAIGVGEATLNKTSWTMQTAGAWYARAAAAYTIGSMIGDLAHLGTERALSPPQATAPVIVRTLAT